MTVESESNNINFMERWKEMKAINSLRDLKIQNSPFNSEIPNLEEDTDNYSQPYLYYFYAAQTVAERMLPLLTI